MLLSFIVLQCNRQYGIPPIPSDVEVEGCLLQRLLCYFKQSLLLLDESLEQFKSECHEVVPSSLGLSQSHKGLSPIDQTNLSQLALYALSCKIIGGCWRKYPCLFLKAGHRQVVFQKYTVILGIDDLPWRKVVCQNKTIKSYFVVNHCEAIHSIGISVVVCKIQPMSHPA